MSIQNQSWISPFQSIVIHFKIEMNDYWSYSPMNRGFREIFINFPLLRFRFNIERDIPVTFYNDHSTIGTKNH